MAEPAADADDLHLRILVDAGGALAAALDTFDQAADGLVAAVVPRFSDWFEVHLVDRGRLRPAIVVHPGPAGQGRVPGPTSAGVATSLVSEPSALEDTLRAEGPQPIDAVSSSWMAEAGLQAGVLAPVRAGGLGIGVVALGRTAPTPYAGADLTLIGALTARIATALERVEQHAETSRFARDAARQAARMRRLMESAVVLGGAATEQEVIERLAAAARRVSGSSGAQVVIEHATGQRSAHSDGDPGPDTFELGLFNAGRDRMGTLVVGRPAEDPEDFELALVSLAQIGGALLENRRLLDRLERSRAHLQAVVDASPDAILEIDGDGRILTANSTADRVLGVPLPTRVTDRLDAESGALLRQRLAAAAGAPDGRRTEVRGVRDGQPAVWSVALAPLSRPGSTDRLVALVADITERRQMEEQLLQAQRMDALGRLAGGVAHDFNNLITAIIGFGELAASQLAADDPAQDDIAEVVGAGRRAADLTAQLLSLGRGRRMERSAIDLAALVAGMRGILDRVLPADITIAVDAEAGTPPALGDRTTLEQVLLNLVINARDAMSDGGTITIGIGRAPTGDHVRLLVEDRGEGMDPITLDRCFEPFFTTKQPGQGTGLGLAAVYGIVAQHEGAIAVRSQRGVGTTITVDLPTAAPQPHPQPQPTEGDVAGEAQDRGGRGRRVLVVEDQPAVRTLCEHILRDAGYEVLAVATAEDAIEAMVPLPGGDDRAGRGAVDARVDLLLTDVVMPGLSGPALAARLRAGQPDLRVLFMSGYAPGSVRDADALVGEELIAKPFRADELAARVSGILDGPGA